jgi:hypothetical protein
MFERRHEPLLPRPHYWRRQLRYAGFGLALVLLSLLIGALGYHFTEGMDMVDALLNASMILFGEGPVTELHTTTGKLFATFYALFSGVAFVTLIAVVFAPLAHRFLHKFHVEEDAKE